MPAITRALVVLAVVVGVLSGAGAAEAQYAPTCGFRFLEPAVVAGDQAQVQISGEGWEPGALVTFYIEGQVLGQAQADSTGAVNATFPLPAQFRGTGEYEITADCPNGAVVSNMLIVRSGATPTQVVTQTGATTSTGSLPGTGSDLPLTLAKLGAVLLAAGALLWASVRRRTRAET